MFGWSCPIYFVVPSHISSTVCWDPCDYCNGFLAFCLRYLTDKQVVLCATARLVLQLPYRSSVSEVMHWQLDVVDRVNYKIGLLVYKCHHGLDPGYLSDHYIPASTFAGRANMRSSSRLDRLLCPTNQNKDTESTRVLLHLVSRVEISPIQS